MPSEHVDVLSEVLKLIRLRGDHVFHGELGHATEVAFSPGPATFLHLRTGQLSVSQRNGQPVLVRAGDFVLLPRGDGLTIQSESGKSTPQRFELLAEAKPNGKVQTFKWGAGSVAGSFLAGSFHFDGAPLRSLLTGLPGLIHLTCDKVSDPPWLASITHFLDVESRSGGPGSLLMISRLIDLLVVRTLRMWVSRQGDRVGWLSGLSDERVGRALTAMHLDPGRAWTVSTLAETAMMSRSTFSNRFSAVVGLSPLRYLTRWRLTLAADLLRSGTVKVTEVVHDAGYGSEAAFSRAFKQEFGYSPSETHRMTQTDIFVARSSE
ncbi:AraC family transcriptional regulator [Pararobbsia alpina]|uniref:AraC family transcriptional regulator n=1 Tax=Pararobbsia alpina TaxID=621374 RepID=UPI0039A41591